MTLPIRGCPPKLIAAICSLGFALLKSDAFIVIPTLFGFFLSHRVPPIIIHLLLRESGRAYFYEIAVSFLPIKQARCFYQRFPAAYLYRFPYRLPLHLLLDGISARLEPVSRFLSLPLYLPPRCDYTHRIVKIEIIRKGAIRRIAPLTNQIEYACSKYSSSFFRLKSRFRPIHTTQSAQLPSESSRSLSLPMPVYSIASSVERSSFSQIGMLVTSFSSFIGSHPRFQS